MSMSGKPDIEWPAFLYARRPGISRSEISGTVFKFQTIPDRRPRSGGVRDDEKD
jgi:hypothetical protein